MSEIHIGAPAPESPVVLDYIDNKDGTTLFRFAFEGVPYEMTGPTDAKTDFTTWLPQYAAETPRCACCDKVIFPGQPITLGTVNPGDSGYSHFSDGCNDTAGGYAGSFDSEGRLVPAIPG